MCGRYSLLESNDGGKIQQIIRQVAAEIQTGEIRPTDRAPVLLEEGLRVQAAQWGFPRPGGSGLVINARSETAAEKPMFKNSLIARRCVVPSTGFYEWDAQKNKYWFGGKKGILYMAGLYQDFAGERRFVILTTRANDSMAPIHDRMPVILEQEQLYSWVTSLSRAVSILRQIPPQLECHRL